MKFIVDADFQLFNNKNLGVEKKKKKATIERDKNVSENMQLLYLVQSYWNSLEDARRRRRRSRDYLRGNQWNELIKDPSTGKMITEEQFIRSQGKQPLKNNQIRQLVKNLVGQYRMNSSQPIVISRTRKDAKVSEMMTNALAYGLQINQATELDARNFEEFMLSGFACGKVGYRYWKERDTEDVIIENVNPNRLFFNSDVTDIRLLDLNIIGEIIDLPLDELVAAFAQNKADEELIKEWYAGTDYKEYVESLGLSSQNLDSLDFFVPSDDTKCRVFEIWQLQGEWRVYAHDTLEGTYRIVNNSLKEIQEINAMRILKAAENGIPEEEVPLIYAKEKYEQFWTVKYLTPYGQVLFESESPFEHQEHPYSLLLYPLVDGEVWGFIEDIIDQQRYINRLISLMDFIMGASAKGVLLVPEEAIPDDMDIDDFASEWTKYNGVIKIKANNLGAVPKQVSVNATNVGAHELLALQMKLIQDISGVGSAIQGQKASPGTASSLYAQEAQNSTISSRDLMDTYSSYIQKRNYKILKVIKQFYQEDRYLATSGMKYSEEASMYQHDLVQDMEFELVMGKGNNAPAYRQMLDDYLFKLLEGQLIDLELFLENSSLPFADNLLESIRRKKEEGQQAAISPELMSQVDNETNPQAMELLNRMLQGPREIPPVPEGVPIPEEVPAPYTDPMNPNGVN